MEQKKQCFVLMAFAHTHNLPDVWDDVIRNGVFAPDRLGAYYTCRRGDDIFDNQAVIDDVVREIEKSDLILAELTTRNPNVFYELGRAHALGKECILLVQTVDDVPFDLRHLRVISYDTTPRGLERLGRVLETTIKGVEERRPSPNFEAAASRLSALKQRALRDPNIGWVMRRLWWMDTEREEMEKRLTEVPPETKTRFVGLPGALARLHGEHVMYSW